MNLNPRMSHRRRSAGKQDIRSIVKKKRVFRGQYLVSWVLKNILSAFPPPLVCKERTICQQRHRTDRPNLRLKSSVFLELTEHASSEPAAIGTTNELQSDLVITNLDIAEALLYGTLRNLNGVHQPISPCYTGRFAISMALIIQSHRAITDILCYRTEQVLENI